MAARPFILVLAGANGAGKSSALGAILKSCRLYWYNPDDFARELGRREPTMFVPDAVAWERGRTLLERAIAERTNFAFETTLGGATIMRLLEEASRSHDVDICYCGLATVELHLARVRLRVAAGGHEIPEGKIRERWTSSRANLIRLMPVLRRLQVFDNSVEAPVGAVIPQPMLVLEMDRGRVVLPARDDLAALAAIPDWAKPLVEAAFKVAPRAST